MASCWSPASCSCRALEAKKSSSAVNEHAELADVRIRRTLDTDRKVTCTPTERPLHTDTGPTNQSAVTEVFQLQLKIQGSVAALWPPLQQHLRLGRKCVAKHK